MLDPVSLQKAYDQVSGIAKEAFPDGRLDTYDPVRVQTAFTKIEAIGAPAFDAISLAFHGPNSFVTGLLVHIGEPSLKYVEHILHGKDERTSYNALQVLHEIGEPALDLIISTFQSHHILQIQNSSARILTLSGKRGLKTLTDALEGDDEQLQQLASSALSNFLINEYQMNKIDRRPIDNSVIPVKNLLIKAMKHNNPIVRRDAIYGLRIAHQLSNEAIKQALVDTYAGVRSEALEALCSLGITQTTAPLLAQVFEDANGELSENAIKKLSRADINIDSEAIMNAIIDVLIVRNTGLPSEHFNTEIVVRGLQQTIVLNPQLHGQILKRLCTLAYEYPKRIYRHAVFVAKRLDKEEFTELINEYAHNNPEAAKAINRLLGVATDTTALVKQLSEAEPGDVQTITAAQIGLLHGYYKDALDQSKASFRWALISEAIGLICLVLTLIYLLVTQSTSFTSVLTAVGSVITQFIAGVQFFLYREARKQVANYRQQLDQTQRFLLANSICESLEGDAKNIARTDLIKAITVIDQRQDSSIQPSEKS